MGEGARRLYRAWSDERGRTTEDFPGAESTVGEGEGCEKMKKYYGVLCISDRHQAEITPGRYGPDVTPKKLALGLSTEMPDFREGEKIVVDCPFCPTETPRIYKATEIVFFDEKDANGTIRQISGEDFPGTKVKAGRKG